ncbi:MAG: choice-of-anchor L domain-containing protein [Fimbriimonadaceae bacterium]|nr:choice-of-anchor L domain-containing protein [Chitinophagales bacterium]
MKKLFYSIFLLSCFLYAQNANAQLVATDGYSGDDLASSLVGYGVTISGITLDCADGAAGKFECIDCNLGLDSGIVLTSGGIEWTEGPNNMGSSGTCASTSGDDDLEDYIDEFTYDACILEFDIVATSDSVSFEYVFGSEEYLEYVFSSYNDGFAFFISGPGITGTENMALVPGTTDPVTINNVNTTVNEEYYVENGDGWSSPYSTDDYYIQYDGFTTVLKAKHAVLPCETYHLKLVLADAGDCVLDSGVFIKAGSLNSPGVAIEYTYDIDAYPTLIEVCNNGQLDFTLSFPPLDTIEVNLIIEGSATNGIDYSTLPTTVTFLPGDTIETFLIEVFGDGILEGLENIIISGELSCAVSSGDSIVIDINDFVPLTAWPDTIICPGETVTLQAEGANVYIWNEFETLNEYVGQTVEATPIATTSYIVTGVYYQCINWDTVTVQVEEAFPDAGPGQIIPWGVSTELEGTGGVSCSWEPAESLDDPNDCNPLASPEVTTMYYLTVTSELGCEYIDSTVITVLLPSSLYIPNVFTPNGDGINDKLNIITFDEISLQIFSVYNRWGKLVFQTADITQGWDGTYDGKQQEIGSYMYIFAGKDYLNNPITKKGTITLLR